MFSGWAEKIGLFGFLAPKAARQQDPDPCRRRPGSGDNESIPRTGTCSGSTDEDDAQPTPPQSRHQQQQQQQQQHQTKPVSARQPKQAAVQDDQEIKTTAEAAAAQLLEQQQQQKRELLRLQKDREMQALARNDFCKNQRVRYFFKSTNTWYENAYIVGIHYDDDPKKPYYTIIYQTPVVLEQHEVVNSNKGPTAASFTRQQDEEEEHQQEMILLERQRTNGLGFYRTSVPAADTTSSSSTCNARRMRLWQHQRLPDP